MARNEVANYVTDPTKNFMKELLEYHRKHVCGNIDCKTCKQAKEHHMSKEELAVFKAQAEREDAKRAQEILEAKAAGIKSKDSTRNLKKRANRRKKKSK